MDHFSECAKFRYVTRAEDFLPPLIVIVGPTAAGKSDFAVRLAEKLRGSIINGDMAQMYKPLSIGTAKPNWREEKVPHLLFDSITEPRDSSAREFRDKAEEAMHEVVRSGRVPLIVGGSLFHISSLFFKLHDCPPLDTSENKEASDVSKELSDVESHALWNKLHKLDPVRAEQIHPHDMYRISRALEIIDINHVPSACIPHFSPLSHNTIVIHITRERKELYDRINQRVHAMFKEGWLDEISSLSQSWHLWLLRKKIIGYDTLIADYFSPCGGKAPALSSILSEDIMSIQKRTRNYAKRQLTFWRSFSKKLQNEGVRAIIECDLTLQPIDLYLEKILTLIAQYKESCINI